MCRSTLRPMRSRKPTKRCASRSRAGCRRRCCGVSTAYQPIESKIQKLARFGEQLSRVRYYQLLRVARIHVAGWLHLPFSEELEQVDLEA
jgi:hypothetical protein